MNEHERIMTALRDCDRQDLYRDPQSLTVEQKARYEDILRRRQAGEPLQYILQQADFLDLALFVDQRVFIPRPETEILVDTALHAVRHQPKTCDSILECGTGCGNIAISLARGLEQAHITTVDVSRDAIDVAVRNAQRYHVKDRISFVRQDWRDFIKTAFLRGCKFDMIISNPPYILSEKILDLPADVRQEPLLALDGGPEGLDIIRLIIDAAWDILNGQGLLALEIGDGQHQVVMQLIEQCGIFKNVALIDDFSGTPRVIMARRRIGNNL